MTNKKEKVIRKRKNDKQETSKKSEHKKGKKWIKFADHSYACPYCKKQQVIMYPIQDMFKYCPYCGKEVLNDVEEIQKTIRI